MGTHYNVGISGISILDGDMFGTTWETEQGAINSLITAQAMLSVGQAIYMITALPKKKLFLGCGNC